MPKKVYCALSGRAAQVVNEQADRYGLPLRGETVDLGDVLRAFHDLLAEYGRKINREDVDDPDDPGGDSPALERYRDEKAKIARLQRLEMEKQLLRRAPVHETLARFVNVWKQAADQLQRSGNESGYEVFVATVQAMEQEKDALLGDLRPLSEELDETNGEPGGTDTGD